VVTANEVWRPAGRGIPRRRSASPICKGWRLPCIPAPMRRCAGPSRPCPTAPIGRRWRPTASNEQVTKIVCAVTVSGDHMHIDYAGTSPQIDRGINCVFNYTHAYSVYPVKCALDPFSPRNEGSYQAISVAAPEGSILNPHFPAPVGARQLTGHLLAGAIYQALAEVVPDRIIAESGCRALDARAVQRPRPQRRPLSARFCSRPAGMGASPHRDGLPTTHSRPMSAPAASRRSRACRRSWSGASSCAPIRAALTLSRGLGQEAENRSALALPTAALAAVRPARSSGARRARRRLRRARADRVRRRHAAHPKSRTTIAPGTRLRMIYAGGGGYGESENARSRGRRGRST